MRIVTLHKELIYLLFREKEMECFSTDWERVHLLLTNPGSEIGGLFTMAQRRGNGDGDWREGWGYEGVWRYVGRVEPQLELYCIPNTFQRRKSIKRC
jgi:hypothetical protein